MKAVFLILCLAVFITVLHLCYTLFISLHTHEDYPQLGYKHEPMIHPVFGEVVYGQRWNKEKCLVYTKEGNSITVICDHLDGKDQ